VLTCMKLIAFRTVDCFGVSNFDDVFFCTFEFSYLFVAQGNCANPY